LNLVLAGLAFLSLALTLWQWVVGKRFPLHRRITAPSATAGENVLPGLTLLKPLKGSDDFTEACLQSWLAQDYAGPVQILFGVASSTDPVCEVVTRLLREFPSRNAQLVICPPTGAANAKVDTLTQLEPLAKEDILVVSDADVRVPTDFLTQLIPPFAAATAAGLVNCFYRLANPATLAMRWEAVAINADFWSQVLQSRSLKPLDFALGAVMAARRRDVTAIGGFAGLKDCLADDYQLGNRIARAGREISLSTIVVECWSSPMKWAEVCQHQVRWARTIRVCQPIPYFFSILNNATLWPLLWVAVRPNVWSGSLAVLCALVRVVSAFSLQRKLSDDPSWPQGPLPRAHHQGCGVSEAPVKLAFAWLPLLKDLLQVGLWLAAFAGNRIYWRNHHLRLRRDGTLVRISQD
jgi:ceramide glucosyltransferase